MRKALTLLALMLTACGHGEPQTPIAGGDHARGREYFERFGCGSCHKAPGLATAQGQVGPSLDGVANRAYVGGVLPNTPENLIAFIRFPQKFVPQGAMPDLGASESEARDMAAYLYTLK